LRGYETPLLGARNRRLRAPYFTGRFWMGNFEVSERPARHGSVLKITAMNGLTFEDGSTELEVALMNDHGPRVGERVMCGKTLVKVAQRRYDANQRLMVMDEDTKAWFIWDE